MGSLIEALVKSAIARWVKDAAPELKDMADGLPPVIHVNKVLTLKLYGVVWTANLVLAQADSPCG